MTATERLYYADSWLTSFTARVVARATWAGRPSVVLDCSAFYPESGGQLGDQGTLGAARVVDVQVDDAGIVHHIVEGDAPAVGDEVRGDIDRARRRVHMALHTGQHMLSRALLDVAGAETMSSRLGASACTVDIARKAPEREIAAAVDLVHAVVDDDVEVRAWFPEPGELASIELRRDPKVENEIRVVRIGDFDASPCGGTHCTRTGQVGAVHVTGVESYKGMLRVWFDAGPRARGEIAAHSHALREIGRSFSCAPEDVAGAIEKLRRDLYETRGALDRLRVQSAERTADELIARATGDLVVASIDDANVDVLRAIARRITAEPSRACLLAAPGPEGTHVLAARGPESAFACGAFVKQVASSAGGRGGGRPEHAEGRLPAGIDWPALVASVL
jgi:alanyl-tRNA synthetase